MQYPPQIERALALVAAGKAEQAVADLRALAERGDGPACYQLAEWHREGELVPGNFVAAREYYRLAGLTGIIEALRRYLALYMLGVGGPRNWLAGMQLLEAMVSMDPKAPRELAVIRAMELTDDGDPVRTAEPEVLSESPRIVRFPNFFTAQECDYLADAADPLFERAETYNEQTGQTFLNPIRTSDTAVFPWVGENPAIHALNRRIAAASGTDVMQGEPLQVLRYLEGQEYKQHIDAIPNLENQRVMTMLVYLNDGFEGGETVFTEAGVTVSARRGDAILFGNVTADGRPDPRTAHAGLPVRKGVKLLASRWIRERVVTA